MLEAEKFINEVFESCVSIAAEGQDFNAMTVIAKIFQEIEDGETGYWQKKNVTDAMNIIERMKLISGRVQPEYTKNVKLLLEVRYGKVTAWGHFFKKLPSLLKWILLYLYRRKKSVLSILGVLSFVHLSRNAYSGAMILSGWLEYIAAMFLLYLLFLFFRRLME